MTKDNSVADYIVIQTEEGVRKFKTNIHLKKSKLWLFLTGTSLISLGILMLISYPIIYDNLKNIPVKISPNSYKFRQWKDNLVPIKMSVYFFNWTNPQDVNKAHIKPNFKEIGPYVFTEKRYKVNIKWNQENGTMTFQQKRYWFFEEEQSISKLTDKITTVNAIALSASYKIRALGYLATKALSGALNTLNAQIHVEKTIGELMFDGYEDKLLNIGRSLPFLPKGTVPDIDKFCWFYDRNGTTDFDGIINMETDLGESLGDVKKVNYDENLPFHNGPCRKVQGSFGDVYPPNLIKNRDLEIYTPEICRSVPLEFLDEENTFGFKSYKYVMGGKFLDNGTIYPENKCYHEGENIPSGVYNVSLCRYGTPTFISMPHFYGADKFYTENVDGLKPEKDKHEFQMNIEPETGIPLKVRARVQLNLLMQKIPSIKLFSNSPRRFFPVMWFEQHADIPTERIWQLKFLFQFPLFCIATGCLLLLTGIFILIYTYFFHTKNKHIIKQLTTREREEDVKEKLRRRLSHN